MHQPDSSHVNPAARWSTLSADERPQVQPVKSIDWTAMHRPKATGARSLAGALRHCARVFSARLAMLLLISGALGAIGCGKETSPRQAIAGRVRVGGQPLAHGLVTFIPVAPTKGPRVLAPVREGEFQRSAEQGPWPGVFRIEITATTPDIVAMEQGQRPDQVPREVWDGFRQVHSEFNSESTLQVTVKEAELNKFDFEARWSERR
jgi:hypothetical protein